MPPVYQGRGSMVKPVDPQNFIIQWDRHVNSALNAGFAVAGAIQDSQMKTRQLEYLKLKEENEQLKLEQNKLQFNLMKEETDITNRLWPDYNFRLAKAMESEDKTQVKNIENAFFAEPGIQNAPGLIQSFTNRKNAWEKEEITLPDGTISTNGLEMRKQLAAQGRGSEPAQLEAKAQQLRDLTNIAEGRGPEIDKLRNAMEASGLKLQEHQNTTSLGIAISTLDDRKRIALEAAAHEVREMQLKSIDQNKRMTELKIASKMTDNEWDNIDKSIQTLNVMRDTAFAKAQWESISFDKNVKDAKKKKTNVLTGMILPYKQAVDMTQAEIIQITSELSDKKLSTKEKDRLQGRLAIARDNQKTALEKFTAMNENMIALDEATGKAFSQAIVPEGGDAPVATTPVDANTGAQLKSRERFDITPKHGGLWERFKSFRNRDSMVKNQIAVEKEVLNAAFREGRSEDVQASKEKIAELQELLKSTTR